MKSIPNHQKKVVLRLLGGLGNQLFIFVFGYRLQKQYNVIVKYDTLTGFFRDSYKRKFRLGFLESMIARATVFEMLFFVLRKRLKFVLLYLFPNSHYLSEPIDNDAINFALQQNDCVFFEGLWQSDLRFIEYSEVLKFDIYHFWQKPTVNRTIEQLLLNNTCIAIHIRRIDYDTKVPIEYYLKGVEYINSCIASPYFLIFSDDIEWCKANFPTNLPHYFIEGLDEVTDLWIMKECKHFIIANSTFSWWGAWLSSYCDKIVLCPPASYWPNADIINLDSFIKISFN